MTQRVWSPSTRRYARQIIREAPKKSELPDLERRQEMLSKQVTEFRPAAEVQTMASVLLDVAEAIEMVVEKLEPSSEKLSRSGFSASDLWQLERLLRATENWAAAVESKLVESRRVIAEEEARWKVFRDDKRVAYWKASMSVMQRFLDDKAIIDWNWRELDRLNKIQRELGRVENLLSKADLRDKLVVELDRQKIAGHEKAYAKASAKDRTSRRRADAQKARIERTDTCPYCGNPLGESPQLDHIVPVSSGGLAIAENLVYCCVPCNLAKQDRGLLEFLFGRGLDVRVVYDRLRKMGKRI